ncbi:neutral zinc metallopeptidase [Georgenia yuyongxinii]|uniref:Neutral zinc metallopeptidase n=1 Tax=Georgenia yuyongxinii TaxID=2589797 RepID=A0A5B8C257_9MICO|nr:neutral zinc metallopeptidase [Georgenia yuyongxinii]QDC24418.1 neutral zinc metallopeptidase [Georgenia yuyongxinii]
MTFNEGVRADTGRVGRSRGRGIAVGGGGLGIVALLIYLFTGQDVSGVLEGGEQPTAEQGSFEHCRTGADANEFTDCRMLFTADALDQYWGAALPDQTGIAYQQPDFWVFEQSVSTGCGNATAAVGPFYCPPDASVYLDIGFFDQLETQLGAENAPLAQMYIVAHEWGHHIQNQQGTMATIDRQGTGPESDGVRLELQADCYAGLWVGQAANVVDPDSGVTFIQPPTREQVTDAIDAAAAVGDDRIQAGAGQEVNPETWTHGAAEQRVQWFTTGYEQGTMAACDTFAAPQL